jgi:hypothetical protein
MRSDESHEGLHKKNPAALAHRGVFNQQMLSWRLPAATAAATTTTARATAAAAATATTLALLRFIDAQRTATHVLAIQGLDGALCIGTGHFDEAKATGTTSVAVVDQRYRLHGTVRFEQSANILFSCIERQIANVDFRHKRQALSEKSLERGRRTGRTNTARPGYKRAPPPALLCPHSVPDWSQAYVRGLVGFFRSWPKHVGRQ